MKLINSLSADYWIENTKQIYEENLHISSPVMEAYESGFKKARELALEIVSYELGDGDYISNKLNDLGNEEII